MSNTAQIRFVDLIRQYQNYKDEIDGAISGVLERGDYILGKSLQTFEKAFARFVDCRYGIGVDSGTSALVLALRVLDLQEGDEVITVPNTYFSTAYAITENKCKVVFVDVDENTQLMDMTKVQEAITEATKAVIPVHLFGQMADMGSLKKLSGKYGFKVVEDACQAHGASQRGVKAGSAGDLACFSFYPGKNLGCCGDGGLIATSERSYSDRLRLMRNYGSREKYFHEFKAGNNRLDSLQAAILNVKLKYLKNWIEKRREIAARYSECLKDVGDLILPRENPDNFHAWHLYVVRTKIRDLLFRHLNSSGIETIIHYPLPLHLQKAYSDLGLESGAFPVAERLAGEILSLPMHADMTSGEVEFVCEAVKKCFRKN